MSAQEIQSWADPESKENHKLLHVTLELLVHGPTPGSNWTPLVQLLLEGDLFSIL